MVYTVRAVQQFIGPREQTEVAAAVADIQFQFQFQSMIPYFSKKEEIHDKAKFQVL